MSNKKAFQYDAYRPLMWWWWEVGVYALPPLDTLPIPLDTLPPRNEPGTCDTLPPKETWDQRYPNPV